MWGKEFGAQLADIYILLRQDLVALEVSVAALPHISGSPAALL